MDRKQLFLLGKSNIFSKFDDVLTFNTDDMIQRIQTLLLIGVVILISLLIFMPLAAFTNAESTFLLMADSMVDTLPGKEALMVVWPLFILLIVMVLVPFVTIFMYKKRMLQIRMTIFSSILDVLFFVLYFYECSTIAREIQAEVSYKPVALIIPVVAILLNIIAIRKIGQDEMLIRSLNSNRIR